MATPTWRNAEASLVLLAEVNSRWPARSKVSDGTLGDAAHQSRESDHNPWLVVAGVGVVRARDVTADGIDVAWFAEHLRLLGQHGDPRLNGGGYVISRARIASERQGWAWRPYSGPNSHHRHLHVSLSRDRAGFDSRAGWGIGKGAPGPALPAPSKLPTLVRGSSGAHVAYWQGGLNLTGGARLTVDHKFGPSTEAATVRFQRFWGLTPDGIVGAKSWAAMGYAIAVHNAR